mgnify:FL=1
MIKKLIALLTTIMLTSSITFADDLTQFCAQPYDMSMKGTKFLTAITGMNFLSRAIANSVVKSELKKSTGAKGFKVKMNSFSAKDLAAGRFRGLDISGDNLDFDGVYVTQFNANTVCDFNYVKATTKDIKFKENFIMKYNMTISDVDLRKTLLSKNYLTFLNSLNIKVGPMNLMELKDVDVKLKADKFYFILKMNNQIFGRNVPVTLNMSSKMKIENGQFKVSEVTFENFNQKISLTQLTNVLNLINPLNFTVDVLNNKNTKLALNNFDIKGNKIMLDGTVFVPKNTEQKK